MDPSAMSVALSLTIAPVVGGLLSATARRLTGAPPSPSLLAAAVAAAVAVAVWAAAALPWPQAAWAAALGWTLLAIALCDIQAMVLPDVLTLPLLAAGLVAAVMAGAGTAMARAAGAVVVFAAFAALALGYRRLRGRDGLGDGDGYLAAAAAVWLEPAALAPMVALAAALGLGWAAVRRLSGNRLTGDQRLPFAPFLCLAFWTIWLHWRPA